MITNFALFFADTYNQDLYNLEALRGRAHVTSAFAYVTAAIFFFVGLVVVALSATLIYRSTKKHESG